MEHEPTPDDLARRKQRVEAFRAALASVVQREYGVEGFSVEFHPDVLLQLFDNGQLDASDEDWATFLAEIAEGEFIKIDPETEDDRTLREIEHRERELGSGKRTPI